MAVRPCGGVAAERACVSGVQRCAAMLCMLLSIVNGLGLYRMAADADAMWF